MMSSCPVPHACELLKTLQISFEIASIIISILQMKKLRPRGVEVPSPTHI